MQGEILGFDEQAGTLSARFPVLENQLNPFSTLQGGFLAAAVDNTFGPLSLLVAPPNVTRRLELTYSHPATLGASAAYRKEMIRVLTCRAVEEARNRAEGGSVP